VHKLSSSSSYFLRFGSIFYCPGAELIVSANPSGLVPGVGRDGREWRQIVGGVLELDHVFAIAFRVLCVKILNLVVMFFFFEVLFVKLYPLPTHCLPTA
jgi:hypothetical protein